MLGHLRPMLTRYVLISMACATAVPAMAASAPGGFARPRVIMAPRFVPRLPARPALARPAIAEREHDRLAAHRLRGRRGGFDIDDGAGAYPVPSGDSEPSAAPGPEAAAPEIIGDRSHYHAGRSFDQGPQIIILPDAPARPSAPAHRADRLPSKRVVRLRDEGAGRFAARAPRHHAYRYPDRTAYPDRTGYEPSYAFEPSPVALAPCSDGPYAPIYNTPCGVRPYQ